MPNKQAKYPFDQIPHIVLNHPDTTPEHWAIMIRLYKILKDKPQCIYSNESLMKDCHLTERSLRRRLDELEKFGFIIRVGQSYNRRFRLGLLFNTPAKLHGKELNTPAKTTVHPGHGGRDTKNSTKKKEGDYNPDYQEYAGKIISDKRYGLLPEDSPMMTLDEFIKSRYNPIRQT